jgi:CNH domain
VISVFLLWCEGCSAHASCVGGGQKVAYGTFDGVYFQDLREPNREPIKVLALTDVAQVDVLDEYGLLIVLSGWSCAPVTLTTQRLLDCYRGSSNYVPSRCA